jgi:hypothetical protein
MTSWPELQGAFAQALLEPDRLIPAGVVNPEGTTCARRFGVYRNNVTVGLSGALGESFPAVRRLVGEDFFRAMAITFARAAPPRSPVMAAYGAGFPDFIARFEPAEGLPYLTDIARIEQAWVEAYHAADAASLDPAAFAQIAPDALPHLRLCLHPSMRVVRSAYAALSIWRSNTEEDAIAPLEDAEVPEDALILRSVAEVEVRSLARGGALFLQALLDDDTVVEAWAKALDEAAEFDLAAHLSGLMEMGAIVGFEQPDLAGAEHGELD